MIGLIIASTLFIIVMVLGLFSSWDGDKGTLAFWCLLVTFYIGMMVYAATS